VSETTQGTGARASVPRQVAREAPPEPTGWVGWILFAGVMMILGGIFQAIAGLTALLNDDYFVVGENGLLVTSSFTTWGWVHLIGGVVVLVAGFAVMAGRMWARIVGVALAGVSAILNLAFLSAYPVWSLIVIAIDVAVIWALTVHGREVQTS
jgi:hypothetical protein